MTNETGNEPPKNRTSLRIIRDPLSRDVISTRLAAALDELSALGAADAALVEELFSCMTDIADRSGASSEDDPRSRHAMGRYNQLSRLSGELEGLKAVLMRRLTDGLLNS